MGNAKHIWKFFRAGGFDQVRLDTGADMLALAELDQKLWVALSCPVHGVEFDARTLELIDSDGDGQVRANEVLAAIKWAGSLLKDPAVLVQDSDTLALSNIADDSDEGRQILASARLILANLNKPEATAISLADLADIGRFVAGLKFNGDGVICPEQIDDAVLRERLREMMTCTGSVPDLSGHNGVDQVIVDGFFADAAKLNAWHAQGAASEVRPLGNETSLAAAALQAVRAKIDDYFTRCQLAAFDSRAAEPLSRAVADYQALAAHSLSAEDADIAALPLAQIAAGQALSLHSGLNPAWRARIEVLRAQLILPLLGEMESLTEAAWREMCKRFVPFDAWQNAKPDVGAASCNVEFVQQALQSGMQKKLNQLITQDKSVEAEIKAMRAVERLTRYQRDLHTLVNNFVSFRAFYSPAEWAIFQAGTLYLDSRSCELCLRVQDVNAHATYASSSGVCLAYCELVRGAEKMNIVAAFTAGDSDFLVNGRHGVFYDRRGNDWNATIVRIVDHPISIRQAFWSPYKKLSKTISSQIQKFAASKANKVQETMTKAVADSVAATPPKPAFDVAKFAGIFAAIGLAIGAIGGVLAALVGGLFSLKVWQIPLALVGMMLAISLPSMALAWFKLKQRSLAPILDACGWAVNARVRINIPFGTSLTALPDLPQDAERSLQDAYAEKSSPWPYVVGVFVLITLLGWAWIAGYFN